MTATLNLKPPLVYRMSGKHLFRGSNPPHEKIYYQKDFEEELTLLMRKYRLEELQASYRPMLESSHP